MCGFVFVLLIYYFQDDIAIVVAVISLWFIRTVLFRDWIEPHTMERRPSFTSDFRKSSISSISQ